jgi:hypothetical protein
VGRRPHAHASKARTSCPGSSQPGRSAGLNDALDYLVLLAAEAPERYDRAARKWLARLLAESPALTLNEAMVALGCLRGLREGYEPSREVLRALVKRRHEARGQ